MATIPFGTNDQSVRHEWLGSFASDSPLSSDAAHLQWWPTSAYIGKNAQTPAKQAVRGISPLSLADRVKNARLAAKAKWNSDWSRAWRKGPTPPRPRARLPRPAITVLSALPLQLRAQVDLVDLVRSYEHKCRAHHRGHLAAAETTLESGFDPSPNVSVALSFAEPTTSRAASAVRGPPRSAWTTGTT